MGKPIDITGKRYGKLIAIKVHHLGERNKRFWLCNCDCGQESIVSVGDLNSGKTNSCGCGKSIKLTERNTKHGGHNTRLYRIWRGLFKRCENPNSTDYFNYGARGVSICDEWRDFSVFRCWALSNGYTERLTIDRLNENGNYGPFNCRWATSKQQAEHKRKRSSFPKRNGKGQFTGKVG